MDTEHERAYQSMLKQRERSKRNYQKRRDEILQKKKDDREKQNEGKERRPVGRPRKIKEDANLNSHIVPNN